MADNFVCTRCGADRVAPRDRFTEALEYRRLDSAERLHRHTIRLVCRACVLLIKSEHAGGVHTDALFTFEED